MTFREIFLTVVLVALLVIVGGPVLVAVGLGVFVALIGLTQALFVNGGPTVTGWVMFLVVVSGLLITMFGIRDAQTAGKGHRGPGLTLAIVGIVMVALAVVLDVIVNQPIAG